MAFFAGSWRAETVFYTRKDHVPEYRETGIYKISWVLDTTYLKWDIQLHDKNNSGRKRSILILITFNPDSSYYEENYFYNGSSLKVFEIGNYDKIHRDFTTKAFIPLEDGSHDEHVRTVTHIMAKNSISYIHYSQYSNEPEECNDFSAFLERVK